MHVSRMLYKDDSMQQTQCRFHSLFKHPTRVRYFCYWNIIMEPKGPVISVGLLIIVLSTSDIYVKKSNASNVQLLHCHLLTIRAFSSKWKHQCVAELRQLWGGSVTFDLLRGGDGRDGLPGRDGADGKPGPQGEMGPRGLQGPPGPRIAGVSYIRWGKNFCPNAPGTELVYSGRAGGSNFANPGGGVEKLCLPHNPDCISNSWSMNPTFFTTIHESEYQGHNMAHFICNVHDQNVPCAVCYMFQLEL